MASAGGSGNEGDDGRLVSLANDPQDRSTGERIGVDLGVDYRLSAPVATALGPVLDLDDVVADKTLALFARALPRDFLDVDALLSRYLPERLLELAATNDRGFVPRYFAEAPGRVRRLPAELFSLPTDEYEALVERMGSSRSDRGQSPADVPERSRAGPAVSDGLGVQLTTVHGTRRMCRK